MKTYILGFTFSSFDKEKIFLPTISMKKDLRINWNHKIYSIKTCKKSGQTIKEREIQFKKEKKNFKKFNHDLKFENICKFDFIGNIETVRRTVIKGKWKNENLIYDLFIPKHKSFWNNFTLDSSDDDDDDHHNDKISTNNNSSGSDATDLNDMLRTGKLSENKKIEKIESNYGIMNYILDDDDPLEDAEE